MLKTLNAAEWSTHVLGDGDASYKSGDRRSIHLDGQWKQGHDGGLEIEVRCPTPVEVNGITETGETVLLAWGQFAHFKGRLLGFAGLEVVATENFAIRLASKTKYLEIPDPVPTVIISEGSASQPLQDAIRQELMKWAGRESAKNFLKTDADINELLDDVFNGDLEFEEEDHHGLPHMRGFEEEEAPEDDEVEGDPDEQNTPEPVQAAKKARSVDSGVPAPKGKQRRSAIAEEPGDGDDDSPST